MMTGIIQRLSTNVATSASPRFTPSARSRYRLRVFPLGASSCDPDAYGHVQSSKLNYQNCLPLIMSKRICLYCELDGKTWSAEKTSLPCPAVPIRQWIGGSASDRVAPLLHSPVSKAFSSIDLAISLDFQQRFGFLLDYCEN